MAQRLTGKIRVDTSSVQGDGSYLTIAVMTLGEMRALVERQGGDGNISVPYAEIAPHILEWDWVNAKGEPLPAPATDPSVLDYLTDDERKFISHVFFSGGRNETDSKNSESG
jgi:hypothetical protein